MTFGGVHEELEEQTFCPDPEEQLTDTEQKIQLGVLAGSVVTALAVFPLSTLELSARQTAVIGLARILAGAGLFWLTKDLPYVPVVPAIYALYALIDSGAFLGMKALGVGNKDLAV